MFENCTHHYAVISGYLLKVHLRFKTANLDELREPYKNHIDIMQLVYFIHNSIEIFWPRKKPSVSHRLHALCKASQLYI